MPLVVDIPKWPLNDPSAFAVPEDYPFEEVACIYVPLSIYDPFARAFDQPKAHPDKNWDVLWRMFLQCFLKTAESASLESPGQVALLWEAIPFERGDSGEDAEIAGYRFWIVLTGAGGGGGGGGSFLSGIATKTVGYYAEQVRLKEKEGDNRAYKFLDRISKGGMRRGEEWKTVVDRRVWGSIVGFVTGTPGMWETPPNLGCDIIEAHFSPALAFASVVFHEDEGKSVDPRFTGQRTLDSYIRNTRMGSQLHFPDPRMVYTVPYDLCRVRLATSIFPHVQVEEDELDHVAFHMIPKFLELEAASDRGESTGESQRKRRRRDLLMGLNADVPSSVLDEAAADFATARNTDRLPEQPAATVDSTMQCLQKEEDLTPFHKLEKQSTKMVLDIERFRVAGLVDAVNSPEALGLTREALGGFQAAFGYTKLLYSDTQDRGFQSAWGDFVSLGARRLRILTRNALHDVFDKSVPRSPKHSPAAKAMRRAVDKLDLLNTRINHPWIQGDMRRMVRESISLHSAFYERFMGTMEHKFFVNHLHSVIWLLARSVLDAWRYEKDLHFHIILMSRKGMTSKSHALKITFGLMTNGTYRMYVHQTTAATTVDGDETGNGNQNGMVKGFEEFPPSFFDTSEGGTSVSESRIKIEMDTGTMSARVYATMEDDNGKEIRIGRDVYSEHQGTTLGGANYNLDEISESMLSRALFISVSELPPRDRPMSDKMFEASRAPLHKKVLRSEFAREFQQIQAIHATIFEPMIHAGILPDVSMDGATILLQFLVHSLKKDPRVKFFTDIQPRALKRLYMAMRLANLTSNALDMVLTTEGKLESKHAVAIERQLFVTVDQATSTIADLYMEILPPLKFALEQGIRQVVRQNLATMDKDRSAFPTMFARFESSRATAPTGDIASRGERDWNYLSFSAEKLIGDLALVIPGCMGDYQPSAAAIRKAVEEMAEITITAKLFEKHPEANVLRRRKDSTASPKPLVRVKTFNGQQAYIQIHASMGGSTLVAKCNGKFEKTLGQIPDEVEEWRAIRADYERRFQALKAASPQVSDDDIHGVLKITLHGFLSESLQSKEAADARLKEITIQRKSEWQNTSPGIDYDLLESSAEIESGDSQNFALDILAEKLTQILGSRFQLPRKLAFGLQTGSYHKVRYLTTGHEGDHARILEAPLLKLSYTDPNKEGDTLHVDLDAYASRRHDERLGITQVPVSRQGLKSLMRLNDRTSDFEELSRAPPQTPPAPEADVDMLFQDPVRRDDGDGGGEQHAVFPDGCYFVGRPVASVSPDIKLQQLRMSFQADTLRADICAPWKLNDLDEDADFVLGDYVVADPVDGEKLYHWDVQEFFERFPAACFGFAFWSERVDVRMAQYKIVAVHPSVRRDLLVRCIEAVDNAAAAAETAAQGVQAGTLTAEGSAQVPLPEPVVPMIPLTDPSRGFGLEPECADG